MTDPLDDKRTADLLSGRAWGEVPADVDERLRRQVAATGRGKFGLTERLFFAAAAALLLSVLGWTAWKYGKNHETPDIEFDPAVSIRAPLPFGVLKMGVDPGASAWAVVLPADSLKPARIEPGAFIGDVEILGIADGVLTVRRSGGQIEERHADRINADFHAAAARAAEDIKAAWRAETLSDAQLNFVLQLAYFGHPNASEALDGFASDPQRCVALSDDSRDALRRWRNLASILAKVGNRETPYRDKLIRDIGKARSPRAFNALIGILSDAGEPEDIRSVALSALFQYDPSIVEEAVKRRVPRSLFSSELSRKLQQLQTEAASTKSSHTE